MLALGPLITFTRVSPLLYTLMFRHTLCSYGSGCENLLIFPQYAEHHPQVLSV